MLLCCLHYRHCSAQTWLVAHYAAGHKSNLPRRPCRPKPSIAMSWLTSHRSAGDAVPNAEGCCKTCSVGYDESLSAPPSHWKPILALHHRHSNPRPSVLLSRRLASIGYQGETLTARRFLRSDWRARRAGLEMLADETDAWPLLQLFNLQCSNLMIAESICIASSKL